MHNFNATLKAVLLASTALISISSVAATVNWSPSYSTDELTLPPVNAVPQMHVPSVSGLPMTLVAEDDSKRPDTKPADNKRPDIKPADSKRPDTKQADDKRPADQRDTAVWLHEYTPTTTPVTEPKTQSGSGSSEHGR